MQIRPRRRYGESHPPSNANQPRWRCDGQTVTSSFLRASHASFPAFVVEDLVNRSHPRWMRWRCYAGGTGRSLAGGGCHEWWWGGQVAMVRSFLIDTVFSLPIRHRMLVLVCWFGDLRAKADLQKNNNHTIGFRLFKISAGALRSQLRYWNPRAHDLQCLLTRLVSMFSHI